MDTTYFIRSLTTRPLPAPPKRLKKRRHNWKSGPKPQRVIDLDSREDWPDTIAASKALKRTRAQVVNACNGWSDRCAGRRLAYVGSARHRRHAA